MQLKQCSQDESEERYLDQGIYFIYVLVVLLCNKQELFCMSVWTSFALKVTERKNIQCLSTLFFEHIVIKVIDPKHRSDCKTVIKTIVASRIRRKR